jgi:hypothetical protein
MLMGVAPAAGSGHDGDDDNAATGWVGALSTPPCMAEAPAIRFPIVDGVASRGGSVMTVPMAITPAERRA